MILWEEGALADRKKIFEFLYEFNPVAAAQTDDIIESRVESLLHHPLMGVKREGLPGRLLIIPEVSLIISYWVDGSTIRVMRVLHHRQKFPIET